MKTFTNIEREAAVDWMRGKTVEELSEMTNEAIIDSLFLVIDKAGGYPVESADKYIAAKNKIENSIKNLNNTIADAVNLGMKMSIVDSAIPKPAMPAGMPMMPPPQYMHEPAFALERIYKDF